MIFYRRFEKVSIWIDAIFEKFLSKREPRLVELDVETEERYDEVQKGSWSMKKTEKSKKFKKLKKVEKS